MILFTTIENFSDRFKIERLYMCYRNLMYKEAPEIVQNPHSAEDAVSESFVRIIKNLHKIDEQNRPKTRSFLVIICRNVAKYAARAAEREVYRTVLRQSKDLLYSWRRTTN